MEPVIDESKLKFDKKDDLIYKEGKTYSYIDYFKKLKSLKPLFIKQMFRIITCTSKPPIF